VSRFEVGRVVGTPAALAALEIAGVESCELLDRHASGDWGEVDGHDRRENELSVRKGYRILSVYEVNPSGVSRRVWIITEADRSVTTILLPEEY
jgi:hypothetical protein